MIEVTDSGKKVFFQGEIATDSLDVSGVRELKVAGCIIEDFSFLSVMPNLEKLIILDCKSEAWQTVPGNEKVRILRLHSLRGKKTYHDNVDFIAGFANVEYLYMANLYLEKFPDVSPMPKLRVVCCSLRKCLDYSALQYATNLSAFVGWMAVDTHRTPAEAFIPILRNPSLQAFEYTQMSKVEDRKLGAYIRAHRPDITYPMSTVKDGLVDNSATMKFIKLFF
jgi:hypothetical protein